MKSENLNFLEPSGPLQACNGTAYRAKLTVVITILTSTGEVPGSYLGWDTDLPDIHVIHPRQMTRYNPKLRHIRFFPLPFRLIIVVLTSGLLTSSLNKL